jgi:hypothetical protein
MTVRDTSWGHRTSSPTPFKNTPLITTKKYIRGFRYVNHRTICGIFEMGKTKPLSMNAGRRKKNVVIMACCLVDEIVDIKSPIPKLLKRKTHVAKKRSVALPANGM